jgi:hypothetical protein
MAAAEAQVLGRGDIRSRADAHPDFIRSHVIDAFWH